MRRFAGSFVPPKHNVSPLPITAGGAVPCIRPSQTVLGTRSRRLPLDHR